MKRRRTEHTANEPSNFNAPQAAPATAAAPLQDPSFWHPERFTLEERNLITALLDLDPLFTMIRLQYNALMQTGQQTGIAEMNAQVLAMCRTNNLFHQYPFLQGIQGAYDFIQRIEDHKRGLETAKGLEKFTLSPSMSH